MSIYSFLVAGTYKLNGQLVVPRGYNKMLPDYTGGVDYRQRKDLYDALQEHQPGQRITDVTKTGKGNYGLFWIFIEGDTWASPTNCFFFEYPKTKAFSTLTYDQIKSTMDKYGSKTNLAMWNRWFNQKDPYTKYMWTDSSGKSKISVSTDNMGGHGIFSRGL